MKQYTSRFGIGDPVMAQTLPAKVVAVTFTATVVLYEVEFESGGAHSTVDAADVSARE
jgi:hypothetical protein